MSTDSEPPPLKPKKLTDGFRDARIIMAAIITILLVVIIWLGKDLVQPARHRTLTVYCFTGMEEVMEKAVFPAFKDHWKEKTGESVEFIPTFAGSGDITEKIISRFPAEVAIFSSKLDAFRLSERGIAFLRQDKDLPYAGILNRTPIVMIARPDNLFNIRDFTDLNQAGVDIAHPDPATSGAGQLGIIAIYGARIKAGDTETEATEAVQAMWRNIVDKPSSAIIDLLHFREGTGDVIITYESNLLANPRRPQVEGSIIYPSATVMCEPTVRAISKNISKSQQDLVEAFVTFLWSDPVQRAFVDYGAHSVNESLNKGRLDFGSVKQTFTIDEIGNPEELRRIVESASK